MVPEGVEEPEIQEPGDRPACPDHHLPGMEEGRFPAGIQPPRAPAGVPAVSTTLLLTLLSATALAAEGTGTSGEEVVVAAERQDAPLPGETSAAVTVIAVDETVSAGTDVAELLDTTTGVTVSRLGGLGDWSGVSIRGSSFRQVQVLLDGVPLNPDGSAAVNLAELPLEGLSRIEVYRGNAPARFGATAMGGVVNLVTSPDGLRPGVRAAVGSHRTGKGGAQLGETGWIGAWSVDALALIDLFHTEADYTYFDDRGTLYNLTDDHFRTRENNDKGQLTVLARVRARQGALEVSAMESFLQREEGLAGTTLAPSLETRLATTRSLTSADVRWRRAPVVVEARLWDLRRVEELDDRAGEVGFGHEWERHRLGTTGVIAHGRWVSWPEVVPALTVSARRDRYVLEDLLEDTASETKVRWALSATSGVDLELLEDRVRLSPLVHGTLLDNRELSGSSWGWEGSEHEVTRLARVDPRFGALVRVVEGVSLKANVGRYVRPPDFTELFGDRGAIHGNEGLLPETGWQADLGVRAEVPDNTWVIGSGELTGFVNRAHDLVAYVQNSQRTVVPVNLGETRTHGLEAALDLSLVGWVDSRTSLTCTGSENLSEDDAQTGNQVPGVPTWEVSQVTSVHLDERVRVGHSWSRTTGSYWDATNWYLSPPRNVHGAFVRVQPWSAGPSLELDVLNLTDHTVEVVPRNPLDETDTHQVVQGVTDFVGYPLPGRTLLVAMRWDG